MTRVAQAEYERRVGKAIILGVRHRSEPEIKAELLNVMAAEERRPQVLVQEQAALQARRARIARIIVACLSALGAAALNGWFS